MDVGLCGAYTLTGIYSITFNTLKILAFHILWDYEYMECAIFKKLISNSDIISVLKFNINQRHVQGMKMIQSLGTSVLVYTSQ